MKHLCSLAAAALLAACITQNDNPPPSDDLDPVDMATIADAARAIYDDVGTDQLRDDLIQVFAALGVPELSASDPDAVAAARGRGAIYALDVGDDAIATAMTGGGAVSLDSFIADLAANGATNGGRPLTRAALSAGFAPVLAEASVPRDQLLVALVLALGRERAARSTAGVTDPVFGDDKLDPLQLALLYYATRPPDPANDEASPAPRSRTTAQAEHGTSLKLGEAAEHISVEVVLDFYGHIVEFPITPSQTLSQAVCAPIYLWSYRLRLKHEPQSVWRAETDRPDRVDLSDGTATLTFDFVPSTDPIATAVRESAGCGELPRNGPAPDKLVTFTVHDQLVQHGVYDVPAAITDEAGEAKAQFQTYSEPMPEPFRVDELVQDGILEARAHDLLPHFANLEALEGAIGCAPNLCPGRDIAVESVHFFTPPVLYAHVAMTITKVGLWEPGDSMQMHMTAVIPLTPGTDATTTPWTELASGDGAFTFDVSYASVSGCHRLVSTAPSAVFSTMRAGVIFDGTTAMPLYFTPGNFQETWSHATAHSDGTCGPATVVPLDSATGMGMWFAFHQDDLLTAPKVIGSEGMIERLAQAWTQPGGHALRMEYDRTSPSLPNTTEHTTIDLSVDP